MSEENMPRIPEAPQSPPADEAPAQTLTEELNELRDIFQQEWNKAKDLAEEEEMPPIQALDYSPEPDADEASEENETPEQAQPEEKKKKRRKPKSVSKGALLILIVCMVLLIIPLLTFFILSVRIPHFNDFINAYNSALAADTDEEKLKYFSRALTYCRETPEDADARAGQAGTPGKPVPLIGRFEQRILENITVLTCKTGTYAAARSYMNEHFTSAMKAKPKTDDFRTFLKLEASLPPISDALYAETAAALDAAGNARDLDVKALMTKLSVHAWLQTDIGGIIEQLASAIEAERAAGSDRDAFLRAVDGYVRVGASLEALGVRAQTLMETVTVHSCENGHLALARLLTESCFTAEELAAPKTQEFQTLVADFNEIASADLRLFDRLLTLSKSGKTGGEEAKAALRGTLSESAAGMLDDAAESIARGILADDYHDLTKAKNEYLAANRTLTALGVTDGELLFRLIALYLMTGDQDNARLLRETYVTDSLLAAASKADSATVKKLDAMCAAKERAAAVFGKYFNDDGEMDSADAIEELQAVAAGASDAYLSAYCNYYCFKAEQLGGRDNLAMRAYLSECERFLPDDPFVYGPDLVLLCIGDGDYQTAGEYTNRMYAITKSDDFTTAALAKLLRIDGKPDDALDQAEKGVTFSGVYGECAHEAAIGNLLRGDFAAALTNAAGIYDSGNAVRSDMELLIILNALYTGNDKDLSARLKDYASKARTALSENGKPLSDAANALISGRMTPEELFLQAPYDLTYGRGK